MPIFEYKCADCHTIINVFIIKKEEQRKYRCPHCRGKNLFKLYSRFASPQSDEARMERLADPSKWSGLEENDPTSMMKFIKKMGKEFGEELGEDYDKMIEEAEKEVMKGKDSGKTGNDLYTPDQLSD
jgi:putative FmdB family regulatory protein